MDLNVFPDFLLTVQIKMLKDLDVIESLLETVTENVFDTNDHFLSMSVLLVGHKNLPDSELTARWISRLEDSNHVKHSLLKSVLKPTEFPQDVHPPRWC